MEKAMSTFLPFANTSQSVGLSSKAGELTLENQGEQVNLYGNATFTVDNDSLILAKQLQQVVNDMVSYLEKNNAHAITHEQIKQSEQANVETVANPFG